MVYRAQIKLPDHSIRSRDFASQTEAQDWIAQVQQAGTYGDPSTYAVEVTDVTEQLEIEEDEREGAKAREIGGRVLDRLFGVNKRKGLVSAQLIQLAGNADLAQAERFLHNGALGTAKMIILAAGPNAGYTPEEIARILAPIPSVKPI